MLTGSRNISLFTGTNIYFTYIDCFIRVYLLDSGLHLLAVIALLDIVTFLLEYIDRCNFFIKFFLLLLLAAITYNQAQSFQINDYANHYVDIEINVCRALYSESIETGA